MLCIVDCLVASCNPFMRALPLGSCCRATWVELYYSILQSVLVHGEERHPRMRAFHRDVGAGGGAGGGAGENEKGSMEHRRIITDVASPDDRQNKNLPIICVLGIL